MGKITVKHYLNTSLKYNNSIDNVVKYPIYLQITANRKTTKLKSLTEHFLTEKEFADYELFNPKEHMFNSNVKNISTEFINEVKYEELKEELKTVVEILEYCFNIKNIEIGQLKLKPIIEFYSKLIQLEFGKYIYELNLFPALIENENTAAIAMFLKSEMNPLDFIYIFKNISNFDIMDILTSEQKEIIIAFDLFIEKGTATDLDKLINWYNGTAKAYFIKKMLSNNEDVNNKILDYINSFAKNVENNLFIELKYNK